MVQLVKSSGLANTVHQPVDAAASAGRNDVISSPMVGISHSRQRTSRAILTIQLARPWPSPEVFGALTSGVASRSLTSPGTAVGVGVDEVVIAAPPGPGTGAPGRSGSASP